MASWGLSLVLWWLTVCSVVECACAPFLLECQWPLGAACVAAVRQHLQVATGLSWGGWLVGYVLCLHKEWLLVDISSAAAICQLTDDEGC